jgi:hypothetical protein
MALAHDLCSAGHHQSDRPDSDANSIPTAPCALSFGQSGGLSL